MISETILRAEMASRGNLNDDDPWDGSYDPVFVYMARELLAARKVVALVRRWTADHPDPCWCLLCNSIRRFDEETQ